ncbi:ATP-binding protein [Flavobacterium sp.]|uniref:ATP-binding protein n=1 Tax=Flavobacterium sp. TaxID=239 RepID=UPI002FD9A3BE
MERIQNSISDYATLPTLTLKRKEGNFWVTGIANFDAVCLKRFSTKPFLLETLLATEEDKQLLHHIIESLLPDTYVITRFILNSQVMPCSLGKSVLVVCELDENLEFKYTLKIIPTRSIEELLLQETLIQLQNQKNVDYETLLAVNYEIASLFLDYEDWYQVLTQVFELVGSNVKADRIYYFENHWDTVSQQYLSSQRFEWVKDGVDPMIDNPELQNLPFDLFYEFMEPLLQGRAFEAIVSKMPECQTKVILASQEIQSILVLPLLIKGHFFGFIGFDDCQSERDWTSIEINFLKSITSNLASAIYRRNATKEKEASLLEKKVILESIGDAFFSVDEDWKIIYWNSMAERMFGFSSHEVVGQSLTQFKPFSLSNKIKDRLYQTIQTGDSYSFERYYKAKKLWLEVSVYSSGTGFSVYLKDITDRKAAHFKLKELNEQLHLKAKELELSNSELEQFAYIASHDLQEPLRMVSSFLQLLEKRYTDIIDETGKKYIDFAVNGALRMRQIITDLLQFSRVGKTKETAEHIDFAELIQGVVHLYAKSIQEHQVQIEISEMPILPSWRSPLQQIFINLLDNAIKYRSKDVVPYIHFSAVKKEGFWQFSVTDNGIGIEAEFYDKIFLIFQRLHTREEYEGSGIGLAVTKKIIEHLGGKIRVESQLGHGSTFHFTLPST